MEARDSLKYDLVELIRVRRARHAVDFTYVEAPE
jgi:hypothetical protein